MADKKLGLKETMKLAPKVVLKKNEPDLQSNERIVEKLHRAVVEPSAESIVAPIAQQPLVVEMPAEEEPVEVLVESKRITLDVPIELYSAMKMKVFSKGITLRKYVLDVVAKDLGK
jgi:hypothetical protein